MKKYVISLGIAFLCCSNAAWVADAEAKDKPRGIGLFEGAIKVTETVHSDRDSSDDPVSSGDMAPADEPAPTGEPASIDESALAGDPPAADDSAPASASAPTDKPAAEEAKEGKPSYESILEQTETKLRAIQDEAVPYFYAMADKYVETSDAQEKQSIAKEAISRMAEFDGQFEALMEQLTESLEQNGYSTDKVEEYRKAYQAAKAEGLQKLIIHVKEKQ